MPNVLSHRPFLPNKRSLNDLVMWVLSFLHPDKDLQALKEPGSSIFFPGEKLLTLILVFEHSNLLIGVIELHYLTFLRLSQHPIDVAQLNSWASYRKGQSINMLIVCWLANYVFFIKSQLITLQGFEARLNFTPVNLQC